MSWWRWRACFSRMWPFSDAGSSFRVAVQPSTGQQNTSVSSSESWTGFATDTRYSASLVPAQVHDGFGGGYMIAMHLQFCSLLSALRWNATSILCQSLQKSGSATHIMTYHHAMSRALQSAAGRSPLRDRILMVTVFDREGCRLRLYANRHAELLCGTQPLRHTAQTC